MRKGRSVRIRIFEIRSHLVFLMFFLSILLLIPVLFRLASFSGKSLFWEETAFKDIEKLSAGFLRYRSYSPSKSLACIASIRRQHIQELKDIFVQKGVHGSPILLMDPGQHSNVGDLMLVTGAKSLANAFGWGEKSIHECKLAQAYVGTACPELIKNSTGLYKLVLWQAGGNWGDLYPNTQARRLESIKYLLDANATVVGLPQSLHYRNATVQAIESQRLARIVEASVVGGAAASRKRLILLWRQADSHAAAARLYPFADNRLLPDLAFWNGPFLDHGASAALEARAAVDLLIFLRADGESTPGASASPARIAAILNRTAAPSGRAVTFRVASWRSARQLRRATARDEYAPRVEAGRRLLRGGRVVVSGGYLHVTVLAMLALQPVFYVDQAYGKVRRLRVASSCARAPAPACDSVRSRVRARRWRQRPRTSTPAGLPYTAPPAHIRQQAAAASFAAGRSAVAAACTARRRDGPA